MSEPVILPNAAHFSEFTAGFNGTCTQTALAVCLGIARGRPATQQDMVEITDDMLAKKLCAPNGAATVASVAKEARDMGYAIDTEWDFGAMGDWHQKLKDNAGHKPILLQVANGQALKDAETGKGDESGVHYHAIAVVGYQDNGYVCADGDNPDVNSRFQVYPYAMLEASQPCGLLIVDMATKTATKLPDGSSDANETLSWAGYEVKEPFRSWLQENGYKLGPPLANEQTEPTGEVYQTFAYGELRYNADKKPFQANIGANLMQARADYLALAKLIEKLRADLA
jgi:hypothetical protein